MHDLIDAFNLIWNFRAAAHSSRLTRRQYASESIANATTLPQAFWPSGRFANVVPDYEAALVQGALDLDVLAGALPVEGLGVQNPTLSLAVNQTVRETGGADVVFASSRQMDAANKVFVEMAGNVPQVYAQLSGQTISVTLNDVDKARIRQAYAKLHAAYAGNDATGFDNEDTLVALLMQGIDPGAENFKRPWLLDSKRVPVGFAERFATDSANLDVSVVEGRAQARLNLNVPKTTWAA